MLRVTTVATANQVTLKLEGKLRGPWVGEVAKVWKRVQPRIGRIPVRVDLSAVSFVDDQGKDVLTAMQQGGAELVATGPLMTALVEEITQSCRSQAGNSSPPQPKAAGTAATPTRGLP
jgi:anti-anti-sigma regulatory factor